MDNPDEKPDYPEAQWKSQKPGFRPEKVTKVEQRPSIHPIDPIKTRQQNLYPSLEENALGHATRSPVSTPSGKPAVSSEMPNLLTCKNIAILVVVIAVILGIVLSPWFVLSSDKQRTRREEETGKYIPLEDRLKERFRSLRVLFSGQIGRLWTVSYAAIRPLLDVAKHPAVILLAGSKQSTATTDCVALKMSEAVKDAFEAEVPVAVFDCRKYKDWEPQAVKREMDRQLTEAFENGAKVGVVLAVEALPGTSPMIFYRFCDTANAPFKNVVLILTLNMEKEATSDRDSEAHEELGRLWHSVLDPEQVDPLFSRIGNSVAYVSEESDLSHC